MPTATIFDLIEREPPLEIIAASTVSSRHSLVKLLEHQARRIAADGLAERVHTDRQFPSPA